MQPASLARMNYSRRGSELSRTLEEDVIEDMGLRRVIVRSRSALPPDRQALYTAHRVKHVVELAWEDCSAYENSSLLNLGQLQLPGGIPYVFLTLTQDLTLTGGLIHDICFRVLAADSHDSLLIISESASLPALALMCYLLYANEWLLDFDEARTIVDLLFPQLYVPSTMYDSFVVPPFACPLSDTDSVSQ